MSEYLSRLRGWWLGQFRSTGKLGKASMIAVPLGMLLTFCCCGSYMMLLLASPSAPAESVEQSSEIVMATEAAPEPLPSPATVRQVTPVPQQTAAPKSTYTPQPTYTPLPTYTSLPTYTPLPTSTPKPTIPRPTSTLLPTRTPPPPSPVPTLAPIPQPTVSPAPVPTATTAAQGEIAVVTNIVDGDTIDVSMNGSTYRVRYIGMDTPETNQACGSEATQANAALVGGQTVRMVRDVSETDRYGRLLRYVYIGDTFVNGALVAGGWAVAKDYPPDTAKSAILHSLMADGAGKGCALIAAPLPTTPSKAPDPIPVGNCDPSYPTVCIPPPPPDLDCKDITHRRFQVLPPDPHRFDGNGDGVGCEG